jgi:ABC-2 type transport system ATP-binding protein
MIEVKNLTKTYNNGNGIQKVNLVAKPGEITILLGENGAGKSTTIKSITGLLKFEGMINICDHENLSTIAKKSFSYIPETPVLYEQLTVQEHVDFIGHAYNLANYKAEADKYLAIFKLIDKKKNLAKELSKGMRQKLSMTLALMIHPKALLIDEPMMGLDPTSIQNTLNILQELKNDGCSILMSTHIIDMIDEIWDSAYIMKKGRVVKHVFRKELSDKTLKELFFSIDSTGATDEFSI